MGTACCEKSEARIDMENRSSYRERSFFLRVTVLALCTLALLQSNYSYGIQEHLRSGAPLTESGALPMPLGTASSQTMQYHLHMYHLHTHESLDVTYRVGDRYVPSALAMLNHFLRDHRTGDGIAFDPHEFDVLHALMQELHEPNGMIDIVCGYRSAKSNGYLHTHTQGVAEYSQHMLGKAIDIRVPGVPTQRIQQAAMSLAAGGVGYYPKSQFVHVDVGPVRHWTFP